MPINSDYIITLSSPTLKYTGVEILNPHGARIAHGVTAIVGPNGSGKSTLARIIERGRNFATNKIEVSIPDIRIRTIEFADIHSLTGFKAGYYQQRYEATMNDEVPTVGQLFAERTATGTWQRLTRQMNLEGIEEKKVNYLSSGELRKMLVINALFGLPDLLILDNPFIGLDADGRASVNAAFKAIAEKGVSIMLLLCDTSEIPDYATDIIAMADLTILPAGTDPDTLFGYSTSGNIPARGNGYDYNDTAQIFSLTDCQVSIGDRVLIPSVSWTVKRGECWALSGRNGCGKSTLLSLIHADNPQAYARPVSLFGQRRGSGETIWDIKRRIGYISPEMHLYFNGGNNTVLNIVAQGLNDTVGMFRKLTPAQIATAMEWLRLFRLDSMADRRFSTLSCGEQRLVLLARTLVKNPELLILDEPLHGLDMARKREMIKVIDRMCRRDNTTLVFVTHNPDELPACVDRRFDLNTVSADAHVGQEPLSYT